MVRHGFIGREAVLDHLERLRAGGKLSQPFLFSGPEGSGKESTALEFARRLNCAIPQSCRPESPCESCVKTLVYQHPDIRWLGPAPAATGEDEVRALLDAKISAPFHRNPWSASGQILIGDPEHPGPLSVRALIRFLRLRAFQGSYKVAVVTDAQRLNTAAANALLKTLEEPPPATVIMLLTSGTEGMLPTILSRCRKIRFEPWPETELAALVQDLGGVADTEAAAAARLSGGNVRHALALLQPEAQLMAAWAERLFDWIHTGRRGQAAVAADELHRGVVSHACLADETLSGTLDPKKLEAKEPALRRGRAIHLCETLNLLYSDAVASRELETEWRPRIAGGAELVARVGRSRTTTGLLADLAGIEAAKADIDGNINIGLAMAVLFEGLIDHAQREQARCGPAPGR